MPLNLRLPVLPGSGVRKGPLYYSSDPVYSFPLEKFVALPPPGISRTIEESDTDVEYEQANVTEQCIQGTAAMIVRSDCLMLG